MVALLIALAIGPRCAALPQKAALYVIPPRPFVARVVSVREKSGTRLQRLYAVTFVAVHGNAVLPGGHRYTQFAYVRRASLTARWCFLKGGSGP